MAFPSVRAAIGTNDTSGTGTNVTITLPGSAGSIKQNDVIFVVYRCAAAGAIGWPDASWNELFDLSSDGADDQMAAAWKRAVGNEGGTTIVLTKGSGGRGAAVAYAIADSADPYVRAPELSTVATGTGNPNATTVTPTGGAKDYLWLTFTGREGEATVPPTYPTNYTVNQLTADSGTSGAVGLNVRVSGAVRTNNNAASEDAGAWTFSDAEDWTAYTIAFHPPPVDPAPGHVRAYPARVVTPVSVAAACVLAFVPIVEAAVEEADAVTQSTGPQVYARGSVQYTPIAGPVVTGSELSWLSTPPGLVQRSVIIRSELAQPSRVDETNVNWLPRQNDLVRALPVIRSEYARPSTETAAATFDVQWWPNPGRVVARIPFVAPFTADPPIYASLPQAADALSPSTGPMVWPRGVVQYVAVAGPVFTETVAATPDLPWLQVGSPIVRRVPVTRHVVAAPPSVTTGALSDLPWLVSPRPPVLAARPVRVVLVTPLGFSEAAPDRALTFNDDGIIRPDRYTHYQAITGPVVIPLETGWISVPGRIVHRVRLPLGAVRAVPISPLDAAGRSDLPWLMPQLQLVRRIPQTRHLSAAPVQFTLGEGAPQIPWLVRGLPPVIAKFPTRHVLVLPVSATAGDLSNIPWNRQQLPLVLAKQPTRHVLSMPPTVPESIDLPWLVQQLPLIQKQYPNRPILVVPATVPPSALSGIPWLQPWPPLVLPTYPTRNQLSHVLLDNYGPNPTADVIILVQADVGIIRVRPDVGIILVLPDVGDVEA